MNRYPRWKNILIVVTLLLSVLYSLPNLFGESPAVQISVAKGVSEMSPSTLEKVETTLKQNDLPYQTVMFDKVSIKVSFANADLQIKAKDILAEALGKGYVVALNLLPRSPAWLQSVGALPMYLGLDLRGGVHFLMQVDMKAALTQAIERYVGDLRTQLREKRIIYTGINREGQSVKITFKDVAELAKAQDEISKNFSNLKVSVADGADGQKVLTANLDLASKNQIQDFALKQNITTLHNRVNELGVAEPIIQQQGADRVVVQLPGVQDTAKAKEILGRTATLEIRMVDEDRQVPLSKNDPVPFGSELYTERDGTPVLVKKRVVLTGEYITNASPGIDQQTGESVVHINLDGRGARIFKQVTRENVGKRMAILLVEKDLTEVITAPVIREEIGGGRVQITGMNSIQEATDVSLLLRAGALAAPMEIIEERTVGPSMGEDNIKRGVDSTLWGFVAIAVMMILYYLLVGIVSVIALGINLLFLVALLSMLQATLTLPGLAAIALTLGMAIDANVLINERIREELRSGNTPQASIYAGYERAFDTILDSNITTMIAGIMLFSFGSGPVRGFAIVHVLGILTSMFSAVVVSRGLINMIYGYRRKLTHVAIG